MVKVDLICVLVFWFFKVLCFGLSVIRFIIFVSFVISSIIMLWDYVSKDYELKN